MPFMDCAASSSIPAPCIKKARGVFSSITMNINQFLQEKKSFVLPQKIRRLAPRIICKDGFNLSVQVSSGHYCSPRMDDAKKYSDVEVGYPSEEEKLLLPYAQNKNRPTETLYAYVPVEVVDKIIEKHGGFLLQTS